MKKRILVLLSLYIDFIFANTLVTTISYLIAPWLDYIQPDTLWYAETLVSVLAVAVFRKLFTSPGAFLLAEWNVEADEGRRLWPNLLLGTLLTLEGLKSIVRWTGFDVVIPIFGMIETSPIKIVLLVGMGVLYVIAGLLILQLSPRSKLVALAATAMSAASLAVSWPVLGEGVARAQVAKRAAQGIPIREGEIEAMQAFAPTAMIAMFAILLIVLFFTRERRVVS